MLRLTMPATHVFFFLALLWPLLTHCQFLPMLQLFNRHYIGDGTYYGSSHGALCQYRPPSLPSFIHNSGLRGTAALNRPQFFGSLVCGMCVRVIGNGTGLGTDPMKGDFVVLITDLCPECRAGDIDLAEAKDGRWLVAIQAVQCPVGNYKLEYKFQGSNEYYIKFQIRNLRIPCYQVKLYQKRRQIWLALQPTKDGFWIMRPGQKWERPVTLPLHIELVAINGEKLIDTIPHIANDVVIAGTGVQFSVDNNLPLP